MFGADDEFYGDEDRERQAYPELNTSANYCQHGTYIGTPWGADYMCHWCESGEEPDRTPKAYVVTITMTRTVHGANEEDAMNTAWDWVRQEAIGDNDAAFEFDWRHP